MKVEVKDNKLITAAQVNGRPVTELTAHVSQEIADWLDPAGKLQKAGLMKIDVNMPEPSFIINDREAVRQGKHCNMDKMLNQ